MRNPSSGNAELDKAKQSLARACAPELDAAANSDDMNAALSNAAVDMLSRPRESLTILLQDTLRYADALGPYLAQDYPTQARICLLQAALNGGGTDGTVTAPLGSALSALSALSTPAKKAPVPRTRPAWAVGKWGNPSDSCAKFDDYREDGQYYRHSEDTSAALWHLEGTRMILDYSKGQSDDGRFGFEFERVDDEHIRMSGYLYKRCEISGTSPQLPSETPPPKPELPATANVRVKLAGYFGTRCVVPSIRNVRRPLEANPLPTSWVGDWVLTNNCPTPQWVRIEVEAMGHLVWAGLQTPGARMQPSPRLVPALTFQPIQEFDFAFSWLLPANAEVVTASGHPVHQAVVDSGISVWIAACDGTGDARRQAIYLSAPFRNNPRIACWNHGLPNGGNEAD